MKRQKYVAWIAANLVGVIYALQARDKLDDMKDKHLSESAGGWDMGVNLTGTGSPPT